jgi:hypothetical protein
VQQKERKGSRVASGAKVPDDHFIRMDKLPSLIFLSLHSGLRLWGQGQCHLSAGRGQAAVSHSPTKAVPTGLRIGPQRKCSSQEQRAMDVRQAKPQGHPAAMGCRLEVSMGKEKDDVTCVTGAPPREAGPRGRQQWLEKGHGEQEGGSF